MKFLTLAATAILMLGACNDKTKTAETTEKDSVDTMQPAVADVPDATNNDAEFAKMAADGGMTEVECSKAVLQTGTSAVKMVADMMITDHTKAGNELKGIAAAQQIEVPAMLSPANRAKVDNIIGLKGAEADKEYLNIMESDHAQTIALFETESGNGKNEALKAFATKTLPTLKHHAEMVMSAKKM